MARCADETCTHTVTITPDVKMTLHVAQARYSTLANRSRAELERAQSQRSQARRARDAQLVLMWSSLARHAEKAIDAYDAGLDELEHLLDAH